jgi:hypothetical protein
MDRVACQVCVGAMVLAAACGGSSSPNGNSTGPGGTGSTTHLVTGVAHLVHGPTPGSTGSANARGRTAPAAAATSVSDTAHWAISPDQGKVTLVSLTFLGANGSSPQQVSLSNCVATYTRANHSLSSILDCPFQVATGTYVGLGVGVAPTFQVLINDAVNGFFSDPGSPHGVSLTRPAGGAQLSSFTLPQAASFGGVFTISTYFTTPLVVDSAAPPTVSLVVDMIHTVFINVIAGVPSFDTLSCACPAVQILPSVSGAGGVSFYSASGTALNVLMPGTTDDESRSVRVFSAALPQPSYVFSPVAGGPSQAWNTSPSVSPGGGSGFHAGGYLGLDGAGNLCWALPTDYTYSQYVQLRRLPVVAAVGGSTTLYIKHLTTVPAPTSGNTYASGCPTFTPDTTISMILVAN